MKSCFSLIDAHIAFAIERKERRGMEIEIEEAEKKRKSRDDRDVKTRER